MISKETIRAQVIATKFWSLFMLSPFRPTKNSEYFEKPKPFVTLRTRKIYHWQAAMCLSMSIHGTAVICFMWLLLTTVMAPPEVIFTMLMAVLGILITSVEFLYVTRYDSSLSYINGLLLLNNRLENIFEKTRIERDGLEAVAWLVVMAPPLSSLSLGSGYYMLLQGNWKIMTLPKYFRQFIWQFDVLSSIAFGLGSSTSCFYLLLFGLEGLININSMGKWMSYQNQWIAAGKLKLHSDRVWSVQIAYRAQQIFHSVSNDIMFHILPVLVSCAAAIMIGSCFCAVRFGEEMSLPALVSVILMGAAAYLFCWKNMPLAAKHTESSEDFPRIYREFGNPGKSTLKFLQSCRPLRWEVGGAYAIKRSTFITLLSDTVIANIINLLLTF